MPNTTRSIEDIIKHVVMGKYIRDQDSLDGIPPRLYLYFLLPVCVQNCLACPDYCSLSAMFQCQHDTFYGILPSRLHSFQIQDLCNVRHGSDFRGALVHWLLFFPCRYFQYQCITFAVQQRADVGRALEVVSIYS